MIAEALELPLKWRTPKRIFVNSMSDLFHPDVPVEYIERVFDVLRRYLEMEVKAASSVEGEMAQFVKLMAKAPPA